MERPVKKPPVASVWPEKADFPYFSAGSAHARDFSSPYARAIVLTVKISHSPGHQTYSGLINEATHLVVNSETGVAVGGIGYGHHRPWVFPFYAPSGRTVVQAFPHAHPWHNGIFAGQDPVVCGGRTGNFWAVPPVRRDGDPIFKNVGRVEVQGEVEAHSIRHGLEFRLACRWLDEHAAPVLSEDRTVRLVECEDAHLCEIISTRRAAYGPVRFPQTKFGGLGLRAEPLLSPDAGAVVIADDDRRGSVGIVHEGDSEYVAFEADRPSSQGGALGVCAMIRDSGLRGPWFVREFGMLMYNPTWRGEIELPVGETWTLSLLVAAYDGPLTDQRARRWSNLQIG